MNVDVSPLDYLKQGRTQAQKENRADLVDCFNQFEDLYEKKLWHQLSLQIDHFLSLPTIDHYLVPLYHLFVRDFETKLNKLNLVAGIGAAVARQLPDNKARIEFLTTLAQLTEQPQKRAEEDEDDMESVSASLLAKTYAAQCQLLESQFEHVASHIAAFEKRFDGLQGMDVRVTSAFYRVAADYYKAQADYAKFYTTSLLFLGTLGEPLVLDPKEAIERAHDLSLAALLSEEIYNFGELLMHPILNSLKSTSMDWLCHLLHAFNFGDLTVFEKFSPQLNQEPLLQRHRVFLHEKLCLMALVDYVFRGHLHQQMPFDRVAKHMRLSVPEMEQMVMRAFSLALVKGAMDQVQQTVCFTWVLPRVLDRPQIHDMVTSLELWKTKVQATLAQVEQHSTEIIQEAV